MKKVETQISECYNLTNYLLSGSNRTKGIQGKKRHFWIAKFIK